MSDFRQDITTREWVIVAPERAKRPNSSEPAVREESKPPPWDESCPFCPGNEDRSPHEVFRLDDGQSGWITRVVPNLYPALAPDSDATRHVEEGIFKRIAGAGVHEVIVETPVHNSNMASFDGAQMANVLLTYRNRYNSLKELPFVRFISVFKNHGKRAGTSLCHPHSQLIATSIAPPYVRRKLDIALQHYDEMGTCLYCDLVQHELRVGRRVTAATESFLAFHPYASRSPFETWVLPSQHSPCFGQASDRDLRDLADILHRTLSSLTALLGDFDFNLVICSSPTEDEANHYYDWHIIVVPRLTTAAGFEIGSGMPITTATPEETADRVRKATP